MKSISSGFRLLRMCFVAAITVILSAACTIQLAPDYDPALVTGIRGVNTDIMSLFSSVGMGTTKETFAKREGQYDQIIGKLNALAMQSQSRPVPNDALRAKIEQYLRDRNAIPPALTEAEQTSLANAQAKMAGACAANLRLPAPTQGAAPVIAGDAKDVVPSAMALMRASDTMTYMRNMDCAKGLRVDFVMLNLGQVQHFMFEALTYEEFLDRQDQTK